MTNPARRKGTSFETDVVEYFNGHDLHAKRTGSEGADLGDLHFGASYVREWTIEAKAEQAIDLPGYLKQLAAAVERRGTLPLKSAVVVKNRRHSTADAYAVMELRHYRKLATYVILLEHAVGGLTGHNLADPEVFEKFVIGSDTDGLFADE